MGDYRYFLSTSFGGEHEVSRTVWIEQERLCGFRPKLSSQDPRYMDTLATGGFGNGTVSGRLSRLPDNVEGPPS